MAETITIDYTNYRGERGSRTIIPRKLYIGSNEWHPDEQWLMTAEDVEKGADRFFAMNDIHSANGSTIVLSATNEIEIDYTNYRGERGQRQIIPKELYIGSNEWHPEEQWLMKAHDVGKSAERLFAVRDIHSSSDNIIVS